MRPEPTLGRSMQLCANHPEHEDSWRTPEDGPRPGCLVRFEPSRKTQIFCSGGCRHDTINYRRRERRQARLYERECRYCAGRDCPEEHCEKGIFQASRADAWFCSVRCKRRAERDKFGLMDDVWKEDRAERAKRYR